MSAFLVASSNSCLISDLASSIIACASDLAFDRAELYAISASTAACLSSSALAMSLLIVICLSERTEAIRGNAILLKTK